MKNRESIDRIAEAMPHPASASLEKKPAILLAATDRWVPTARMAMALVNAGCSVDAVCPSGHPLAKTRVIDRMLDYNGLMPVRSIERAIRLTRPDLVIPCDDLAASHLHELYRREHTRSGASCEVCTLIERSLGSAAGFEAVRSRSAFLQVAQEEGIRIPRTQVIENSGDLLNWIAQVGFPMVLKANGTSGGQGVKVVNTVEESERALRKLQAPPLAARALKRALVDRDLTLVWPSISRRRATVSAQAFVAGHEATSAIACWNGTVIASLHFEVIEKTGSTGHATVVRQIEHAEMSDAAVNVARRLKLSGLHGLDFMLEAETGKAYLIEINPRTTQVGHLALGPGHDLPAALFAAITGTKVQPVRKVTENDTIALFPQEWKRDAASPFLTSAYHDVPWEEPALVSACVSNLQKQRSRNSGTAVPKQIQPASSTKAAVSNLQATNLIAEQNKI